MKVRDLIDALMVMQKQYGDGYVDADVVVEDEYGEARETSLFVQPSEMHTMVVHSNPSETYEELWDDGHQADCAPTCKPRQVLVIGLVKP